MGANSFLYEITPVYMGGNTESDRVSFPESIPFHLSRKVYNILILVINSPVCVESIKKITEMQYEYVQIYIFSFFSLVY